MSADYYRNAGRFSSRVRAWVRLSSFDYFLSPDCSYVSGYGLWKSILVLAVAGISQLTPWWSCVGRGSVAWNSTQRMTLVGFLGRYE